MTKSERTKAYIIEKTAPLFNIKGFDGTTLSDLTNATGLTKGALYGHFEDKDHIAIEAFQYSNNQVKQLVQAAVSQADTYRRKLEVLFDFYARYVFDPPIDGGCPLLNAAVEADDHRTSMRKVVARELLKTVAFIEELLMLGVKAGEFDKKIKPRELAYTFFCAIEGALMFARVERSREPMDIIISHCKNKLNQISL